MSSGSELASFWQAVAVRFGLGAPDRDPQYVARGAMGEIWRLEAGAHSYAVKILFEPVPGESLPLDIEVQTKAVGAGLRLPAPVLTPDGVAVPTVNGRSVRAYTWEDLDPPLASPVAPDLAGEVGRMLGVIHSLDVVVKDPEVWWWYTTPPSPSEWASLLEQADARGASWSGALRDSAGLIDELSGLIEPLDDSDIVICHRDFDPSNVLTRTDGSGLSILDWENVGPLPAGAELGYVLLAWTANGGRVAPDSMASLLAGYNSVRPEAALPKTGWASVAIVTLLNFLMAMGNQALDDDEHRRFAEDRLNTMLGSGLVSLRDSIEMVGRVLSES
jgi:Ser/Thr protein kinase RdoA (MazF antagonist)